MVRIKPVTLLWVVHFHQPLGNFSEVFVRYANDTVRPFLANLDANPSIKVSLHFSGVIFSHLKKHHKDLMEQLAVMVARDQVELLGGGFYEPIFSLIPPSDIEAQLRMMSDWLEDEFHTTPRGVWLPESVWEPHFVSFLHKAGIAYALLDESLFTAVGWKRAQLFHPFRTQYLNDQVTIFPIHRQWSKQIPLQNMRDIRAAFTQLTHRQEQQMVILAQNGEQFTSSSELNQIKQDQEIMAEWFRHLIHEQGSIQTSTLHHASSGRWPLTYLPSGSMADLESHSMVSTAERGFIEVRSELHKRFDSDRFVGYLRGGTWLNFFAKYGEARLMQNKLLWLYNQIQLLPQGGTREEAEERIWAAEEHSAYWHAETGGVYSNYLRDAVYQRLIEAEKFLLADQSESDPPLVQTDYNGDGDDEVLLRTELCGLVAVPNYGGSLCEFNFWPSDYNLANTFRRRQEAYFTSDLPINRNIEDWHERRMFQDHFVPPQTNLTQFQQGTFVEHGDFINQPYEIVRGQYAQGTCSITLERQGGLYFTGERRPLTCQKNYTLNSPGQLDVTYNISNPATLPTDCLFISEINYTLLDGHSSDRRIILDQRQISCGETLEIKNISSWRLEDTTRKLRWIWSLHLPATLWHFPIMTPSRIGNSWGENYQGSVFLVVWPLKLESGKSLEHHVTCVVEVL